MTLRALLLFSVVAVALCAVDAVSIDHDKVQPFAEPEPATTIEKAAVKFKPKLQIHSGCHPYPAVNAAGETNAGLKGSGSPNGGCKGSGLGSQVYGRAAQYKHLWAIMYAWYFPKDNGMFSSTKGHRHSWMNIVLWIDNPDRELPMQVGASYWAGLKDIPYEKFTTFVGVLMDYGHPVVALVMHGRKGVGQRLTSSLAKGGDFQDLIMWEQLTDEARRALNETDFGGDVVPFIDAHFMANLDKAWSFE